MKRTLVVVLAVVLALGIGSVAYASSSYVIKSNGILRYDGNGDGDFTDSEDVVFDSNDLVNINNSVSVLKTGFNEHETQLQVVKTDIEQLEEDVSLISDSLQNIGFDFTLIDKFSGYSQNTTITIPDISSYKALCLISTPDDIHVDVSNIVPIDLFRTGLNFRCGHSISNTYGDGTEIRYISDTSVLIRNVKGSLYMYGVN